MKVAFTGTQKGMTKLQQDGFWDCFRKLQFVAEFIQGCCIGADEQAAFTIHNLKPYVRIIGYPCTISDKVSGRAVSYCYELHRPLPPLERNVLMVDRGEALIATPSGPEEVRSGTWSTVRNCRKKQKTIYIVWPDGKVTGG